MSAVRDVILENRLRKIIEANQALAQVESLSELLPRLLQLAQDVVNAAASSILLYDASSNRLKFALAKNDEQQVADTILDSDFSLAMGEGIAGQVAQEQASLLVADARSDERFCSKADDSTGFVTRSLLCTPIMHKDELLGVVQVLNPRHEGEFTQDDTEVLESFAHLAAVALVRSRLLETLLEQERMQAQLEAAAGIQRAFLPALPALGQKYGIWAASEPAIHVGGDLYDCITFSSRVLEAEFDRQNEHEPSFVAYIADVAGKGLPAALLGAAIWSKMRSLVSGITSPAEILQAMNSAMREEMDHNLFVTMIVLSFNAATHTIILANAGHSVPVCTHGNIVQEVSMNIGLPLGIEQDVEYTESSLSLRQGESLLLYSDGLEEARNATREFLGTERMYAHLAQADTLPYGPALLEAVRSWQHGVAANDDKTVLEIWRN